MSNESLFRLLHPYQRAAAEMIGVNFGADARRGTLPTLAALALMHSGAVIVEPTPTRRQETVRALRDMSPSSSIGGLGSGADVEVVTYRELEGAARGTGGVPYDLVILRERIRILDAAAAGILSWVASAGRDILVIDETCLPSPAEAPCPVAAHVAVALRRFP